MKSYICYLLDFQDKGKRIYFPARKMEPGETPEDALIREIREELDADISVDKFLYTVDWDYPKFHLTMHCFMSSLRNDTLHLNEHEAARWLDKDEIHSVKWLPADEVLLPLIVEELESKYNHANESCPFPKRNVPRPPQNDRCEKFPTHKGCSHVFDRHLNTL